MEQTQNNNYQLLTNQIFNDATFINRHLIPNTPLRSQHLNMTDIGHARKVADTERTYQSSNFDSEEILQTSIYRCLCNEKNINKLIKWLQSDKQELNLTNGTMMYIGKGIAINKNTKRLTEYFTGTTSVRLMKNPNMPDGFAIITAFPVITIPSCIDTE